MDTTFLFSWVKYKFGIRAAKFIIQVLRVSRVTFIRMFSLSSDTNEFTEIFIYVPLKVTLSSLVYLFFSMLTWMSIQYPGKIVQWISFSGLRVPLLWWPSLFSFDVLFWPF